ASGGRAAIPRDDALKDFSVERFYLNLEIERFQLVIIATPGEEQDPDLPGERLLRPREELGERLGVVGAGILLFVLSRKDHLPQRAGVYSVADADGESLNVGFVELLDDTVKIVFPLQRLRVIARPDVILSVGQDDEHVLPVRILLLEPL